MDAPYFQTCMHARGTSRVLTSYKKLLSPINVVGDNWEKKELRTRDIRRCTYSSWS